MFGKNDLVLVSQPKNLAKSKLKYEGPFRVVRRLSEITYLIATTNNKIEQIHVRRLIPYLEGSRNFKHIPPPISESDTDSSDDDDV